MSDRDKELRLAILRFDKARGQTGADFVNGKITRLQADSEYEDDIAALIATFRIQERDACLSLLSRISEKVVRDDEPINTSQKSMKSPLIKIRYRNELRKQQRQSLGDIRVEIEGGQDA